VLILIAGIFLAFEGKLVGWILLGFGVLLIIAKIIQWRRTGKKIK
jgi:hypothetical protein